MSGTHRRRFTGAILLSLAACASTVELDPVDLEESGWRVRTGQASWYRGERAEPISGDLVAAIHEDGRVFINLGNAAVSFFTAQADASGWAIRFVDSRSDRAGRGAPPGRFVWFSLPGVLDQSGPVPAGWTVERDADYEVTLSSKAAGERIHVILD